MRDMERICIEYGEKKRSETDIKKKIVKLNNRLFFFCFFVTMNTKGSLSLDYFLSIFSVRVFVSCYMGYIVRRMSTFCYHILFLIHCNRAYFNAYRYTDFHFVKCYWIGILLREFNNRVAVTSIFSFSHNVLTFSTTRKSKRVIV